MNREGNWKPVVGFEGRYSVRDNGAVMADDDPRPFCCDMDPIVILESKGLHGRYSRLDIFVSSWLGLCPPGHVLMLDLEKSRSYMPAPEQRYSTPHSMRGRADIRAFEYVPSTDSRLPSVDTSLDVYDGRGWEPIVRSYGSSEHGDYIAFRRKQ